MHPKAQESLERLLELFAGSAGELPEVIAESAFTRRQNIGAPCERWSTTNAVIMIRHGTNDARTYNQWRQVGRHPKKGSKAFHIFKPHTRKPRPDEGEDEEKRIVYGFGSLPVFRYKDTEGEDLEQPDYTPISLPPLYEVAQALGVSVKYAPTAGFAHGSYQPGREIITLMTYEAGVFFHELAHAADARASGPLKSGQDPDQEVIAEVCAATLCVMYGFEGHLASSKKYIESYAIGGVDSALVRVLSRIGKAMDVILEVAEPEDSTPANSLMHATQI